MPDQPIVVEIEPLGGLGNRMLQYLAARTLSDALDGAPIAGARLDVWNIQDGPVPPRRADEAVFEITEPRMFDPAFIAGHCRRSGIRRVVIKDYVQKIGFFPSVEEARRIFPLADPAGADDRCPEPDALVINVRTSEILDGYTHYPLPPVAFIREVVQRSGLRPVLFGQVEPSFYCEALLDALPDAAIVPSRGAMADFSYLRRATHLLPCVSTFSWLACWLSRARTITLPLTGFYNPAHLRDIDLLPTADPRYRFQLFPLNFGVPDAGIAAVHARLHGRWREVSPAQVDLLRFRAPRLAASPAELRGAIALDETWYVHQHLEAAVELSEGWFGDAVDHYLQVGHLRGYRPLPPDPPAEGGGRTDPDAGDLVDLGAGATATQSSICAWSIGATPEEDAGNVLVGEPTGDYSCHTDVEWCPWWQVDLGAVADVAEIVVFNRVNPIDAANRLRPFVLARSDDGERWRVLLRTDSRRHVGGADGAPFRTGFHPAVRTRYLRIFAVGNVCLHLDKVRILGRRLAGAN